MMRGKGYDDAKGSGSSSRPGRGRVDDDDDEEEEEVRVEMEVAVALDTTECLAWPDLLLSQIFSVPASSLSKVFLDLDTNYNTSNSCVQCVEALDCDRMSNYMLKWEEEELGGKNEAEDQGNDYTSRLPPIIPPHWDGRNSMVGELNSQPSGSLSTLLGNQAPKHSSPLLTQSKTTNGCPSWLTQGWSMPTNVASKSQKGLDDIQNMKDPKMCSFMEGSTSTIRKAQKILKGSSKTKLGEKLQGFEFHNKDIKDVLTNSKIHLESPMLSTKRSRCSEIHNLSERRRRDRINERMRALQELIPRSIKTDQASLLEEVIRYMKSLQTQVQIMSFRARICIPPSVGIHPRQVEPLNMAQMVSSPNMGLNLTMEMNMGDNGALGMTRKSFESSIPTGTLLSTPLQDYSLGTPTTYPTCRGFPVSNPFSHN